MPELPEVEVVRRGLAHHVLGRRIASVRVLHPRAVRRQPGGAEEFSALLTGRALLGTGRRGKFLWMTTDDPDTVMVAHLGMSGQFRVVSEDGLVAADLESGGQAGDPGAHPHLRVELELDRGRLSFLDQRTFGWVAATTLVPDPYGTPVPTFVARIAPDPTEPGFDLPGVARVLHARPVEVKRLLLDQSRVSGIGNIYADEALWRAGVHPRRRADRLTLSTLRSVLSAATQVMAESLAQGGTSFDDLYVDVNGRGGYFGRGLSVYGRHGLPCPRCGTPIVRERFMNRSSHFCPRCQPPPRTRHWTGERA